MNNQKGFIQIPLLIIVVVSVVIASAGTGVILHKQGKLSSITANISGVFKKEVEESVEKNTTEEFSVEQNQEVREFEKESETTDLETELILEFKPEVKESEIAPEIEEELIGKPVDEEIVEIGESQIDKQTDGEDFVKDSGSEFGGRIHDYFPIILSFSTEPSPSIPLRIGDEIHLKVEVYDSNNRQVLYSWWCATCDLRPISTTRQWTTNNEIRYRITSKDVKNSGESMRIGVYIKSEKEYYRTGIHGYDDMVYADYKISIEDSKYLSQEKFTALTGPLGGNIIQNSKLTLTNSPYIVTKTIQILEGVTLEIEPGVTIKFEGNTGINVGGVLKAVGTKTKVITFTSNNGNPSARDWNEINFTDSSNDAIVSGTTYVSGSIIENSKIEYAYRGIWINNSSPFISNNFFTHNENSLMLSYGNSVIINNTIINNNKAIYLHGSSPTIFNNTITDNIEAFEIGAGSSPNISKNIIKDNENGFSVCCYANPTIQHNNIVNNGENGETLWLSQVSDVTATNNYWGIIDNSIIDNIIHDYYDNINLGKVLYEPIATSEIPDAGAQ